MIFEKLFYNENFDKFFALKRWNGLNVIRTETVPQHTFFTMLFSKILIENLFPKNDCPMLKLALYDYNLIHDGDEVFDNDVSFEVKYNVYNGENIRKELSYFKKKMFEENGNLSVLDSSFSENESEVKVQMIKRISKIADWLSCVFYVGSELKLGNKSVSTKYDLCWENLKKECDSFVLFTEQQTDYKNLDLQIIKQLKTSYFTWN